MSLEGPISSRYAYSSARVKAMESKLIGRETMKSIIDAKDAHAIISILVNTDYRKNLEEFGGIDLETGMIDFALSKNLASNVGKLITITPMEEKGLIRTVLGKWDLYNVKLAIDAKSRGLGFSEIEEYIIDYGPYNISSMKEMFREATTEGLISSLSINSPYRQILAEALEFYRKSKNAKETNDLIDRLYYNKLGLSIPIIMNRSHESAYLIKLDIDMRNIIQLIRSKHYGMSFQAISNYLIKNGTISIPDIQSIYESAKDVEEIVKSIKVFDLSKELEDYKKDKAKRLFVFEIGMRNSILAKSMNLLRHAVLSFGTIIAYAYIKEIEVTTLRILLRGKHYGLSQEELSRLIVWRS